MEGGGAVNFKGVGAYKIVKNYYIYRYICKFAHVPFHATGLFYMKPMLYRYLYVYIKPV